MKIKAYTLNSFAKSLNGGNPAAVVLNADNLLEEQMKKIASIIGFSETAFVMNSKSADFKVRFFTPNEEVNLCGHGTIATFSLLTMKKIISVGKYSQETKAGILNVEIKEDLSIMMDQNLPTYFEIVDKEKIAKTLNIDIDSFVENLPIQIVSTGLRDIIIPLKNKKMLESIKPDFNSIAKISKEYNIIGYHVFALESSDDEIIHCRNLAPLYGIDEESATGTSNGALCCYLFKYKRLNSNQLSSLVIKQGYLMGKPSEIIVNLEVENDKIIGVKVGGSTLNLEEVEIEI